MTNNPDRRDEDDAEDEGRAPIRPSAAEGGEETGGPRPPRPSQAEGERDESDDADGSSPHR